MMSYREVDRVEWVDVAKGICIVLVVMMHATFGVTKATGAETWLHPFIEWARPFRMPDFFLVSGLFLSARIGRPWASYLDSKVVHFAYFYALWLTIQFALRAPALVAEQGAAEAVRLYLISFVEPYGTLWFIHLLAIFFVIAKVLAPLPKSLVLLGAAILYLVMPATGWIVVDEFASRFVFFYLGYAVAPYIFAFTELLAALPRRAIAAPLFAWAALNALAVTSGLAFVSGFNLLVSTVGIVAVIAASVLIWESGRGKAVAYCGQHSIAIYLAFTLFMGPTRVLMLKAGLEHSPTLIAVVATLAGVLGSLALRRLVVATPLAFLFERPKSFRLATAKERSRPVSARIPAGASQG